MTEEDCYLKEDGGITVQKFLSSKTSLEDTSGAALASYSPKLGKKKMKKLKKAEREKNKGKDWFNMPVTTSSYYTISYNFLFQRHWSLLKRGRPTWSCCRCAVCLIPRGFIRGATKRGFPSTSRCLLLELSKFMLLLIYSLSLYQIGTVVDNAADFYTDRVPNKARKSTMVDELLADAEFKKFQKRK